MEEVRSYLLSIIAAAILCGILKHLAGKSGNISTLMKLMSGIVMAAVIIQPVAKISSINLKQYLYELNDDAAAAVALGTESSRAAVSSRIIEGTKAYILDKAAQYALDIQVEVLLDETQMIPVQIEIQGNVSPAARRELEIIIQRDLGIPMEAQIWK